MKSIHDLQEEIIDFGHDDDFRIIFSKSPHGYSFELKSNIDHFYLLIKSNGSISENDDISKFSTLSSEAGYYLFQEIIKNEKKTFSINITEKNWTTLHFIMASIFAPHTLKSPITFKGVILRCDFLKINSFYRTSELPLSPQVKIFNTGDLSYRRKGDFTLLVDETSYFQSVFNLTTYTSDNIYRLSPAIIEHNIYSYYWDNVHLYFSDGMSFSLRDIFFHPYSVLVPFSLFNEVHLSSHFFKVNDFHALVRENLQGGYFYRDSLLRGIIAFLNNYLNLIDEKNLFYITPTRILHDSLLPVVEIESVSNEDLSRWVLIQNKLMGYQGDNETNEVIPLSTQSEGAGMIYFKNKKGILARNSFGIIKKNLSKSQMINTHFDQILENDREYIATFIDGLIVNYPLNLINKLFTSENVKLLNHISAEKLKRDKIDIQFYVERTPTRDYRFKLNIELKVCDGATIGLKSFPDVLCRYLLGMNEGLKSFFFDEEVNHFVISKSSDQRKNDLKLLRHTGVFKYLVVESLQFIKLENKTAKDFKIWQVGILQKCQLIIGGPLSIKGEKAIKKFLRKTCFDFFESEVFLLSQNGKMYEIDLYPLIVEVLEIFIELMMRLSKENTFEKIQSKDMVFESVVTSHFYNYFKKYENDHSQGLLLFHSDNCFIPFIEILADKKTSLFLDGRPLGHIASDELVTNLAIEEHEGKIDWFSLHPKVFFKGIELHFEDLLRMKEKSILFHQGTPYYVQLKSIPKLHYLDKFWNKLLSKHESLVKNESRVDIVQKEKAILLEILALKKSGVNILSENESVQRKWNEILNSFYNLENEISVSLPSLPLKPYQVKGVDWMCKLHRLHLGGILADDMGLGKTIQAIGLLETMFANKEKYPALIVVPTSLVFNWQNEIKKFAPHLPVDIYESKRKEAIAHGFQDKKFKILIVTYGLLTENEEFFTSYQFETIIFDEAQNLKNIKSKRTGTARRLNARSLFCLTGTPMENHFGEFYSLVDLCVPGVLGEYLSFMRDFEFKKVLSGYGEEIDFLKRKTSPLVLRRHKRDLLLELPEKTESTILLPFEKEQQEIYKHAAISWNDEVKRLLVTGEEKGTQLKMFTALLRLRQICTHPAIVDSIDYDKIPPKLELLFDAVSSIIAENESVIIFTHFVSTLKLVENMFRDKNFSVSTIHGGVHLKERQKVIAHFSASEAPEILIMTLKTGGVGLNLTKASFVVHLEPWWNPAVENQATDRAHRMGQTRPVQVYRYIMKDSVEEKIQELKLVKGNAFSALFSDAESSDQVILAKSFSGKLDQKDFEFLIST